jgi:CheB methylesterase
MADFRIIGIGASVGGIDAFHSFFDHMLSDRGMAFVMVLHLPADRKSMLMEILARAKWLRARRAHPARGMGKTHGFNRIDWVGPGVRSAPGTPGRLRSPLDEAD